MFNKVYSMFFVYCCKYLKSEACAVLCYVANSYVKFSGDFCLVFSMSNLHIRKKTAMINSLINKWVIPLPDVTVASETLVEPVTVLYSHVIRPWCYCLPAPEFLENPSEMKLASIPEIPGFVSDFHFFKF